MTDATPDLASGLPFDPERDLAFERVVDVPPALVWRAWTEAEHLTKWFTPAPWTTPHAELDVRPGGRFHTVMRGPNGEEHASTGCYLVVEPGRRLIWTDALGPAYRPNPQPFMTAQLTLTPEGPGGTRYHVIVAHADAEARAKHEAMGFLEGWGAALDQLVAMVEGW